MTPGLERRYRRLLWCYPRRYRRRFGDELVATMLDVAAPGQTRPSARDVRDMVGGGLRRRFRLPLGWSMVAVALLASVALGAFGAAAGSWLGWIGAGLPGDEALREVAADATGQEYADPVVRPEGPPTRTPAAFAPAAAVPAWSVEAARERLLAAGWRVDPATFATGRQIVVENRSGGVTQWRTEPMRLAAFTATRDGLRLWVSASTHEGRSWVDVWFRPARPAAVVPLTGLGLLLGAIAGWLLTAWLGYRVRDLPRLARWAAAAVSAAGLLALAHPTIVAYERLAGLYGGAPDEFYRFPVFGAYLTREAGALALAGVAAVLGVLALTAMTGRRAPRPEPATRPAS